MRLAMLFLAASTLAPASQAAAQSNDTGEVDVGDAQQNNSANSKLGLLGLLGLAGLFGLKRRAPDIHVDARRDKER
jgi:MYXO-CTERM domain-containing protein